MDRYQRVEKPREEPLISENEIRITTQGRTRSYVSYATSLFQDKGSDEIVIKAMGRAIYKAVMIMELLKRRLVLHQNTATGSTDVTDAWETLEEGLLPLKTTRPVSMIIVALSKKQLDASAVGYQPPSPKYQVNPLPEFDYEGEGSPGGVQSRGRGGRGRGRAENGTVAVDYKNDGGCENRGLVYGRGGCGGREEAAAEAVVYEAMVEEAMVIVMVIVNKGMVDTTMKLLFLSRPVVAVVGGGKTEEGGVITNQMARSMKGQMGHNRSDFNPCEICVS